MGGDRPDDIWTDLCVRDAELIVAVTGGRPAREWLSRAEALRGCELIVVGTSLAAGVMATLAATVWNAWVLLIEILR